MFYGKRNKKENRKRRFYYYSLLLNSFNIDRQVDLKLIAHSLVFLMYCCVDVVVECVKSYFLNFTFELLLKYIIYYSKIISKF
jgi:hypothetical protein